MLHLLPRILPYGADETAWWSFLSRVGLCWSSGNYWRSDGKCLALIRTRFESPFPLRTHTHTHTHTHSHTHTHTHSGTRSAKPGGPAENKRIGKSRANLKDIHTDKKVCWNTRTMSRPWGIAHSSYVTILNMKTIRVDTPNLTSLAFNWPRKLTCQCCDIIDTG